MRTNRLFCFKKRPKQNNSEAETKFQKKKEMGSQVSTKNRQKSSSQNYVNSEMAKCKRPLTEKPTSSKPDVLLKRRRSYSECDNLSIERPIVCKKLRVNQLYTDYCGRNSFMAAFFRLLGEFLKSRSSSLNPFVSCLFLYCLFIKMFLQKCLLTCTLQTQNSKQEFTINLFRH